MVGKGLTGSKYSLWWCNILQCIIWLLVILELLAAFVASFIAWDEQLEYAMTELTPHEELLAVVNIVVHVLDPCTALMSCFSVSLVAINF